jgi:hypothetical protein
VRRASHRTGWIGALALALAALALAWPRGVGQAVVAEVTVYVDADDEFGDEIVGQEVRLIPAVTQPPALELPDEDGEQDQTGYDGEPFQGITGQDGRVVFKGAPLILGLPEGATGEYKVTVPGAASTGYNAFFKGKLDWVLGGVPDALRPYMTGATLTYDGLVAVSFQFPVTRDLASQIPGLRGLQGQELNTCKDMAPAGSPDTWPEAPPGSDLPSARLDLAGPGSAP